MKIEKRRNRKDKEKTRLELALERADEQCRSCCPPTPLDCIGNCKVWHFRNELRQLVGILAKKDYKNTLLNTLKNKRRLAILGVLSKSSFSIPQLQKELKAFGYAHSQETLLNEYVEPLVGTGLAMENSNHFKVTALGNDVCQLFEGLPEIEDALPPHSECYEERIIEALLEGPKTYEELKVVIPNDNLKRVLARLLEAGLITKNGDNNYIFYFRTKRLASRESLSSTEKRVYESIPEDGTTGEKLAAITDISLRRTYKYIRKLKGKKLVFKRKHPKTYALTEKGVKISVFLEKLRALLTEFTEASVAVTTKTFEDIQSVPMPDSAMNQREEKPLPIFVKRGV